jgi:hypothetical protein
LAKKYHSLCHFLLELTLLVRWDEGSDAELAEAITFLAKKVIKISTGWTSDNIMQLAYKLIGVWREN